MRVRTAVIRAIVAALGLAAAGCSGSAPSPSIAEFVIDVDGERFVIRITDNDTIRLADEAYRGLNRRFPIGTVRSGNGGFNAPWTWHLEPASVRLVEVAVEVCDGRPSYVETHQREYPTYCPWGARVVSRH